LQSPKRSQGSSCCRNLIPRRRRATFPPIVLALPICEEKRPPDARWPSRRVQSLEGACRRNLFVLFHAVRPSAITGEQSGPKSRTFYSSPSSIANFDPSSNNSVGVSAAATYRPRAELIRHYFYGNRNSRVISLRFSVDSPHPIPAAPARWRAPPSAPPSPAPNRRSPAPPPSARTES